MAHRGRVQPAQRCSERVGYLGRLSIIWAGVPCWAKPVAENADLTCRLITDDSPLYKGVGAAFEGGHQTVLHSAKEYVRRGTDVHTNSIEGVFSLIKRGVMGTFHSVSRKHLPNYLNEFEFRWNTRKLDDGERVSKAIKQVDGKRLQYRESVDNPPYFVSKHEWRVQPKAPLEG